MRPNRSFGVAALAAAAALLTAPFASADELAVGTKGPDFTLLGVDGKQHALAEVGTKDGKPAAATVVVFTCNHCPFSQAYEPVFLDMAKQYADKSVSFVFINSNDPQVAPGDSYEKMQERAKDKAYPFPYLYDATQAVAKAYGARVTPHVYVLDAQQVLRYRGRVNDNKDQTQVKSNDLITAIDGLLAGKAIETAETKAFGCGIKWKKES